MLFKSFFFTSESRPLYVVRIVTMVHYICCTVAERRHSVQFAGADAGEIGTDTAEGHLEEICSMSVAYDRASNQRRDQWAERLSPGASTRIRGKTGEKQFEF